MIQRKEELQMKKVIKNIIDKSVGKAGDKLGEKVCTLILYQPKVCRRMKK